MNGTAPAIMREILDELTETEGLVGSALIDYDGIVVAESFVVEVNLEKVGALLSSIYNTLQRIFDEIKQGTVRQAWFETERYGFLLQATPIGLLLAVARHDARLGLIRLSMRAALSRLARSEPPG